MRVPSPPVYGNKGRTEHRLGDQQSLRYLLFALSEEVAKIEEDCGLRQLAGWWKKRS